MWNDWGPCMDRGAGPYQQERTRYKFFDPVCRKEGKPAKHDSQWRKCNEYGEWGSGKFKNTVKTSYKEI